MIPAHRILCIRLDNIGDVVMASPAIQAVRRLYPSAEITLLTGPWSAAVVELIPEIDHVLTFAAPWVKTPGPVDTTSLWTIAATLRQRRFDLALILTDHDQTVYPAALLAFMAGIPHRLSYMREDSWQLINHPVPEPRPVVPRPHSVERQLRLVQTLSDIAPARHASRPLEPAIRLTVPASARSVIRQRLATLQLADQWLLVNPIVHSQSGRQYPLPLLRQALHQLSVAGYQFVFTGTTADLADIAHLQAEFPDSRSLAAQTSLAELAALIELAPLILSNDSGPVHLAAGLATPVVGLYLRRHAHHTPYTTQSRVLYFDPAAPADDLPPEQIASVVQDLLAPAPAEVLRG